MPPAQGLRRGLPTALEGGGGLLVLVNLLQSVREGAEVKRLA